MSLPVPDVSDIEVAFPTGRHTPPWDQVPEEFKNQGWPMENPANVWVQLARELFMGTRQATDWHAIPKPGVDPAKAWKAIQETMGNWGIKHERKLASLGYMFSEWFEDFWWTGDSKSAIHGVDVSNVPTEQPA